MYRPFSDNSRMDLLYAMCMATNISHRSQVGNNNGDTVGHIAVGGIAGAVSTEHSPIAVAQGLQQQKRL